MINKILNWFSLKKKEIKQKDKENKENYIGSLSFKLTENYDIDLACSFPETTNRSLEELTTLAEKFAQFLMTSSEGDLKEDVIRILKNSATKSVNDNDYLFLENVLVFWAMLHVETQKHKRQRDKRDQPVIRPISVFNRITN